MGRPTQHELGERREVVLVQLAPGHVRDDARLATSWPGGRDVFVYFDNDGNGHAVRNAGTLRQLLL